MAETFSAELPAGYTETQLPHSIEAEQGVLGGILIDPEMLPVALEYISEESFFLDQHKELFRLMNTMFIGGRSASIDIIVVLNEALRRGIFESEAEGKRYLFHIAEEVPSPENVKNYARIVAEKHNARKLAIVARELLREVNAGTQDADTLLDYAEQSIYNIRQGREVSGLVPISSVVVRAYQEIGERAGPDRDKFIGARTGFPNLDSVTGGMNKSDLVVLAARPGMGKTSFALNLAMNVANSSGKEVAIYSLEMSMEQLVTRMLSTKAKVDSYKLRTGRLDPKEWASLAESADLLSTANIFLAEAAGLSVSQMKAQLRRKSNLGMVVIDYLQLMSSPDRTDNRVLEISAITRNLKLMAKELNVPVLLLSQLNRGVEQRPDKHPQLSDLRDSGSIEQDADIILFLYNDFYYHREKAEHPNITECIIAKNRHGETGKIDLIWDAQYTRFSTPETKLEAPPV